MGETTNKNWVFLPVHKSRIALQLDRAVILKVEKNITTILPLVFKRKKESENLMFFSLPENFNINIRVETWNSKTHSYDKNDRMYVINDPVIADTLKSLSTDYKEVEKEDTPF